MLRNWIFLLMALGTAPAALGETLPISYIERRPFYFTEKDQPAGTMLERVRAAAGDAKIPHQFVPMAIPRIMAELKSKKPHCSIGWYKTAEREKFAVFTEPFARDTAFVILTKKELAKQLDQFPTVAALFSNKNLTLGVANGFSYGEDLDKMIREQKPKLIDTEPEHGSLITMLAKGRFSYMLVVPEELDSLLAGAGLDAKDFHTRKMSDMPPGGARYVMCSKATPKGTTDALNTSFQKLYPGI